MKLEPKPGRIQDDPLEGIACDGALNTFNMWSRSAMLGSAKAFSTWHTNISEIRVRSSRLVLGLPFSALPATLSPLVQVVLGCDIFEVPVSVFNWQAQSHALKSGWLKRRAQQEQGVLCLYPYGPLG